MHEALREILDSADIRQLHKQVGGVRMVAFVGDPPSQTERLAEGCCSREELKRATRYLRDRDRKRFLWRRSVLRYLLSSELDTHPSSIVFEENAWGKLTLPSSRVGLHFNVSHCKGAFAVSTSPDVINGVDVERVRLLPDLAGMAKQVMMADELDQWNALPTSERVDWFYRLWVLKESVMKCGGYGFSLSPKTFQVRPAVTDGQLQSLEVTGPDAKRWGMHVGLWTELGDKYLALAVQCMGK